MGGGFLDGPVILGERATASPALASRGGQLHLGWTGRDYRLNLLIAPDGRNFTGKRTLPVKSSRSEVYSTGQQTAVRVVAMAPALAGLAAGLRMAWTGQDRHVNLTMFDDTGTWYPGRLDETSGAAPAVADLASEPLLAWTGTDRHLNFRSPAGSLRFNETSSHGPAMEVTDGRVALAWTGTDRRLNLSVTQGSAFGPPIVLGQTSSHAPSLCALGPDLIIAWTGTDRHLNLAVVPPDLALRTTRLDHTSRHGPAVCVHAGTVVVAWTGRDGHLNLGQPDLRCCRKVR